MGGGALTLIPSNLWMARNCKTVKNSSVADPRFSDPKLSIFWPSDFSILGLTSRHNSNSKNFQFHFAQHIISQLVQIKSRSLSFLS